MLRILEGSMSLSRIILERVKFRLRSGASSQVHMASVSGTVRDADKLTGTGGNAARGNGSSQSHRWLLQGW
jgi:hypothetical protein